MKADLLVRPFQGADARACAQVFYDAVQTGAADRYSQAQRDAWAAAVPDTDRFRTMLEAQTCYVACHADLCGFMSLKGDMIDMAFVAPDMRGKGVADLLYAAVLNAAKVQRITRLKTNASHLAKPFFTRFGWQVDAPETVMRGDQPLQRFQMSQVI